MFVQFSTDTHAFYKNERTLELDEGTCRQAVRFSSAKTVHILMGQTISSTLAELGDIQGVLADFESSIIRELEEQILLCQSQVLAFAKQVDELDWYM